MEKFNISYEDQFGHYIHYQTLHHLPSARKAAEARASKTGKRHLITSQDGALLDLFS